MKQIVRLIAVMMPILLVMGCMTNKTPRHDIGEPLEIIPYKRLERYPVRDYVFRFQQTAYSPVTKPITHNLSDDQRDILSRHGQPDYTRKRFKARNGDVVDEWLWHDQKINAQFVQRDLVWEGEMTDMDKIRLQYGYPRRAWYQDLGEGVKRDLWEYQGVFMDHRSYLVTFSDERLVSEQYY